MTKKICSRCGNTHRVQYGGKFQLKRGKVGVDADLCKECYEEMLEAYRNSEVGV